MFEMDKQREEFEKAYEPNPNKSPFTEVKFDEVARVYKPLDQFNPRIASSLNAAWYGWRIRQAEVDGLQAKVEELQNNINLLNEALDIKEQLNQKLREREDELQKRVDELEKHLKPCECGSKEINVDQEGYVLKHCYRCGGFKTQEMIEQALKGEG